MLHQKVAESCLNIPKTLCNFCSRFVHELLNSARFSWIFPSCNGIKLGRIYWHNCHVSSMCWCGVGCFQHFVFSPRRCVCVIHRWVTPNSYRKWHTIEPWYDKCAEYVQWKGNNRSWAAALKWFPDGNSSGIIDEPGKGKLLVKTKGKHKKLLFSGWSALEAEKKVGFVNYIVGFI